jgi:hypothetical protein
VGLLEHDLFLCPLVTCFGFCFSDSDLGPLCSSFSPFAGQWSLPGFHHHIAPTLPQSSVSSAICRVFWKMKCSILEMSGIFFSFSGDGITEKEEELEQVFTL